MVMLLSSALGTGEVPAAMLSPDLRSPSEHVAEPRRRQQRIAEITEMIHVATLVRIRTEPHLAMPSASAAALPLW